MTAALCHIRLNGELGKRFGRSFRMRVKSPGEAIRAINSQRPGFARAVAESGSHFHVVRNGKRKGIAAEEIRLEGAMRTLSITPIPQGSAGSGKAIINIVVGVILTVVSFYAGGAAGIGYFGATAAGIISRVGISIGLALALSGVSSLLTSTPKATQDSKADNKASYIFSGPVNTLQQGGSVPVVYGDCVVGSAVGSAGITARSAFATPSLNTGNSDNGPTVPGNPIAFEP